MWIGEVSRDGGEVGRLTGRRDAPNPNRGCGCWYGEKSRKRGSVRERPLERGGESRLPTLYLFRHRSDTIWDSVVSETLGFMVGVAGFEPATPSSRTRSPDCKIKGNPGL
jgi:hypothetical protein